MPAAGQIARHFLDGLQLEDPAAPPPGTESEWVHLTPPPPGQSFWERARWLESVTASSMLEPVLSTDQISEQSDRDISRSAQVAEVLACKGDFVAVVRDGRFDRLLDRRPLLEAVAARAVNS